MVKGQNSGESREKIQWPAGFEALLNLPMLSLAQG